MWLCGLGLCAATSAQAFTPFTAEKIRVDGLQRIPVSKVFRSLPFDQGDRVTPERVATAIKRIFGSGDFRDVRVVREGDTLVIIVAERPSISKLTIDGNKSIKTEDLEAGLKQSGLAQGSVLQRATLERIQRELERQYVAQGRYGAQVDAEVVPRPRNRAEIKIDIKEGNVARIKQINIIGNRVFSDAELTNLFELSETNMFSFFKGDDKYARERLAGDLERLRSFYLDRGYIQFQIESTQVAIDPNKENIYVTVTVEEGGQFQLSEVKVAGVIPFPEDELDELLAVSTGETFSRSKLTQTEEAITRKLGDVGYTFASVKGLPDVGEDDNTVAVTFLVEPGKRVTVRRVNFEGNEKTADNVMRREMRQMEGAWASAEKIELSKVRLQRLGFFKGVKVETPRVPGTEDQVDLNITVEEQPSGSIGASVGYQGGTGVVFGANLSQRNFLGTGNQVEFALQRTRLRNSYRFEFLDPYYTIDGVSRGFNFYFSETDFSEIDLSRYRVDAKGFNVSFGYPISENTRLNFSLGLDGTRVYGQGGGVPNDRSDSRVLDFIGFEPPFQVEGDNPPVTRNQSEGFLSYVASGSWRRSTLNKGLLPDRGASNRLALEFAMPGGDLEYYRFSYQGDLYFPLNNLFTLRLRTELGYGDGYGDTGALPFYKHYFSGGIGSIRGYENRSIGPLDDTQTPDPFGGNLLTEASMEFIFPTPFVKDKRTVRTAFFIDAGSVFNTTPFINQTTLTLEDDGFDTDDLRYSAGVGLTWITAIGPLSFTFAKAFNEAVEDETQVFDFTLGTVF
jgi:outer membrane protein insertion porin family